MAKALLKDSANGSQTPQQRLRDYIQSRGMRNTEQRRVLLDHIFRCHQHFDADQLMEQLPLKGKPGHVSRPTVYRALSEFVDAGLLRRFELDGCAVYEPAHGYEQHDHLYCEQCHQLLEFQSDDLVTSCERVARKQRFRVSGRRIVLYGICAQCAMATR
ncbi:MAG: Fur family transcriptional regulator [Pirellulaceae bacterium]